MQTLLKLMVKLCTPFSHSFAALSGFPFSLLFEDSRKSVPSARGQKYLSGSEERPTSINLWLCSQQFCGQRRLQNRYGYPRRNFSYLRELVHRLLAGGYIRNQVNRFRDKTQCLNEFYTKYGSRKEYSQIGKGKERKGKEKKGKERKRKEKKGKERKGREGKGKERKEKKRKNAAE